MAPSWAGRSGVGKLFVIEAETVDPALSAALSDPSAFGSLPALSTCRTAEAAPRSCELHNGCYTSLIH